jgi:hypothetical protein
VRWDQDLQVKLRERYRRLYTATGGRIAHEIDLVVSWIASQPALRYILDEAQLTEKPPNPEEWVQESLQSRGMWDWPTKTDAGRAVLVWTLLCHISESSQPIFQLLYPFATSTRFDDQAREFAEQVARPLFDYLGEKIGDSSSVLYALERYARQVEWFDQGRLYGEFQANSRQGEQVYDRHLREFLFHEGFNMPYSQLRSPSGQADVLSGLDTDDPLACELKVFDGQGRNIAHLASGVTQAMQYACDHKTSVGQLVIVNLSTQPLQLPSDGPDGAFPPYLDLPGVRVYVIQVRGLPRESASKQGKTDARIVERDQLAGGRSN